ncbi:MAG: CDP-alcohol phosphatidyltransferase family protein [Chloroflexota bacterium]
MLVFIRLDQIWMYAVQWFLIAAVVQAYCLWLLWQGLTQNHRENEDDLFTNFGLANKLTLTRGLMISLMAGFLFSPWPEGGLGWVPGLLYGGAIIIDYFDGYCARLTDRVTILGGKLDMDFDSLGMFLVTSLAVWYGQLPWPFFILGIAYYLFVFGLAWRKRKGRSVKDLQPSFHRRLFAGFLMVFMSITLLPILSPLIVTTIGSVFGVSLGLGFWRDWLVVSDRLDPYSPSYRKYQQRVFTLVTKWLPLLLRLMLGVMLIIIYRQLLPHVYGYFEPTAFVQGAYGFGLALVAITTVFGIVGRVSAIFVLLVGVTDGLLTGASLTMIITLLSASTILLYGSGYFAVWQPYEKTFAVRL